MNDPFEKRVRTAAVAGWWTVLIAWCVLLLHWLIYLAVINSRPAWMLSLWGPDITWPFAQTVWFWFLGIFKFSIWLWVLVCLWLTLWARQLRKGDRS